MTNAIQETELVPQEIRPATMQKLTAAEIRADVQLIQQVLKAVMIEDVHYGIVPGCGDKPTLLKPGAEKIMATFRLNGEPIVEDLSTTDEIRYRIKVRVTHQITKLEIGWGVGEASSSETKYKWIAPVGGKEEFEATPDDKRQLKWKKGKDGKPPYQVMQIRANLSDVANTVLKMAKKRALVDATLTCTGASDVFAQDLEDLPEDIAQRVAQEGPAKAGIQRASETAPAPAAGAPQHVAPQAKPKPQVDGNMVRKMSAKFTAPCRHCSKPTPEGTSIIYVPEGPSKGGYHVDCIDFIGE